MDVLHGKIYRLLLANIVLIHWSVRSAKDGRGLGKVVVGGYRYFSQLRVFLYEKLVNYPRNNLSATRTETNETKRSNVKHNKQIDLKFPAFRERII